MINKKALVACALFAGVHLGVHAQPGISDDDLEEVVLTTKYFEEVAKFVVKEKLLGTNHCGLLDDNDWNINVKRVEPSKKLSPHYYRVTFTNNDWNANNDLNGDVNIDVDKWGAIKKIIRPCADRKKLKEKFKLD